MKLPQYFFRRRGQTLIEAIIALGVLTVGFLGILALLSQSFFEVRTVSDRTTATYLAAEGIELTKNVLDHVMYGHAELIGNVPAVKDTWPCFPTIPGQYQFDYTILAAPSTPCSTLKSDSYKGTTLTFDPTTGLYGYGSGSKVVATNFAREIDISESPDGSEITVRSIVRLIRGGVTTVEADLSDQFYNWVPAP